MRAFALTRTKVALLVCVLLAGYFVSTAAAGTVRQREQQADRAAALAELDALRARRDHLLGVYHYVASDAYVEQAARRQLGYTRAGEIPFVVLSPPPLADAHAAGEWWERLFPR